MTARRTNLRAFSLIELLLSVFILAIGIISVSALFPAGIAQQQQTTDDLLGTVVAEQALGLLRSRVSPEDFGTFEEFGIGTVLASSIQNGNSSYVFRPSAGDWSWIRPGVIRNDQPGTATVNEVGAIDIFSTLAQNTGNTTNEFCEFPSGIGTSYPNVRLFGAPYNSSRTTFAPPVIVTQRERWWPTVPEDAQNFAPPTYAWDCMFRRSGGKLQVAIFVFRVTGVGGAKKSYVSPSGTLPALDNAVTNGSSGPFPPVPYRRVLVTTAPANSAAATTGPALGNQVPLGWQQPPALSLTAQTPFTTGLIKDGIAATAGAPGQGLTIDDFPAAAVPPVHHQWQLSGQWIVDNNGNVHRVAVGRRNRNDPIQVRLSAPIPRTQNAQVFDDYELRPATPGAADPVPQGVRTLHYVPAIIDANGTQLVPVYATVRDL